MDPQLKRGMLEACALAVLARGDSYGYQMVKDVGAHVEVSESTLYPILRGLERRADICACTAGSTADGCASTTASLMKAARILKNCAGNGGKCWTYMPSSWKERRERHEKRSVFAGAGRAS